MIEAAGLAFPRAPLDAALARLAVGAVFDALVVAAPAAGRYRLSVLGASLDLETGLPLEVGERVRLAVKSAEPLTLEIRPVARGAAEAPAPGRPLAPELEAAVRAFAGGDAAREEAARFLASRGLGVDPAAARGLAALLRGAVAGGGEAPADAAGMLERALAAMKSPGAPLRAAAEAAIARALPELAARPEFAELAGPAPERAAAALKAAPALREAVALLEAGRSLSDAARAVQVLNADAASRGESVAYFAFGWVRDGRPEGGFGRVEARPGGSADPAAPSRVVVTLELTRLGLLQVAIALAAGAASVTVAASPAARRLLERGRQGLVEALLKLGLRPELRFSDGPLEPILPRSGGGLDVRA